MSIYEIVTNKIISQLEKGIVPWRRPWVARKYNLFTKKSYKGINLLLINKEGGYATWKQIHEKGLKVKKGAKAKLVVFYKPFWIDEETREIYLEDQMEKLPDKSSIEKKLMLRYYYVFHEDSIEGLNKKDKDDAWEATDPGEFVASIQNKPNILLDSDESYYLPKRDEIHLPKPRFFNNKDAFFQTLFHELIHSTGHPSRLNRLLESKEEDAKQYAFEELIADIGSAMLCSLTGVDPDWQNTASYIGSWLNILKNDRTFILKAANQAQKSTDWLVARAKFGSKLNEVKEKLVVFKKINLY